ncbi:transcription factor 7-like 1-A isoform X2 [Centropristis striata]|uniref:transcription factor 7-like 1-A isoform X2 n=1 Tax=Centropristis striata TaxID=184440 RepID=UPI0027E0CF85|nr:transcription factor 7-like 1-A isoform X2 [Centropristis striata]
MFKCKMFVCKECSNNMSVNRNIDKIDSVINTVDPTEMPTALMDSTAGVLTNLPPPAPLPPDAVKQSNCGGHCGNTALVATFQQTYHLQNQAYPQFQGQNLPYICTAPNAAPQQTNLQYVYLCPYAAAASYPAVPQQTYNNLPLVKSFQNLVPVAKMNRMVVYKTSSGNATAAANFAAPPPPSNNAVKKQKREDDDRQYVKKPLNAFMLFMKDQRANVKAEMEPGTRSSVINTLLGRRWNAMSNEEQARYYDQADKESKLHEEQHPNWSVCNNYGKKRRVKSQLKKDDASASISEPPKKQCVTPTYTGMMGAPYTPTGLIAPSPPGHIWIPHTQTPAVWSVNDLAELPDVYSWFDIPGSPSCVHLTWGW